MLVPKWTCTDILYVPKLIVPILTFNVSKLDVPKKHVPKVYVPKLSCTESDPWQNTPSLLKIQNMHWPQRTPKEHNKDRKGPQQDFKFGCHFALFGSNMYQILCQLGLRHRPHWGAYSTPPDPLGVFGPLWDVHFPFLPCDAAMLARSWEL